ncbi:MAG: sigma-70 family RNA polymerase sigma factor [Actinomycetota bacterium]
MDDRTHSDPRAEFTAIYEDHYLAVRQFTAWQCEPSELDDVVADVFLVAWRRFNDLEAAWARPWLFGVAKNVLRSRQRSVRRAAAFVNQLVALRPALATNLDAGELSIEDVELIKAGLQALTSDDQEVLILSTWYEMTAPELAIALSITKNNATVRLHRARIRFRTIIAGLQHDEKPA